MVAQPVRVSKGNSSNRGRYLCMIWAWFRADRWSAQDKCNRQELAGLKPGLAVLLSFAQPLHVRHLLLRYFESLDPVVLGFGDAMLGWPLTPDFTFSIFPPASRKALILSSRAEEVSTAAGCFFLPAVFRGFFAMVYLQVLYECTPYTKSRQTSSYP